MIRLKPNNFQYIFYSLLISITIFIVIFEGLCYVGFIENKKEVKIEKVKKIETTKVENDPLDLGVHYDFIYKMKHGKNRIENNITKNIVIPKNQEYIFFERLLNSGIVIIIIYLLLIFSLFQQLYIFFLAKKNFNLSEIYFYKSEWSINVAPMLGLLGTFFSISILLNNNNGENLSKILIQNFFNATMTTIIGIVFYIISLYLKIYIVSSIEDKKDG